jgi:OmpA-OmpF porin, OOP family
MSIFSAVCATRRWPVLLVAVLLLATSSQAQQSPAGPDPQSPSTQNIIDALKPEAASSPGRTRGLSLEFPHQPGGKPAPRVHAVEVRHVDLQIQFDFDSDQLTPEGVDLLQKLSQALASRELSGISSVMIEGHTDGVGSAAYNRALSLRRAMSVRRYLHSVPELGGKKFRVVGKGASELLSPEDPAASINRRVRVLVHHVPEQARDRP